MGINISESGYAQNFIIRMPNKFCTQFKCEPKFCMQLSFPSILLCISQIPLKETSLSIEL